MYTAHYLNWNFTNINTVNKTTHTTRYQSADFYRFICQRYIKAVLYRLILIGRLKALEN